MIIDQGELKQRYLKRLAGASERRVCIGPEVVALDINNACNLSCRYCWTHGPGNPAHFDKARFFPWKRFLGIVRDCVELHVDQIHITGAGEPTLHPLFRDMMRHLKQQPLKVKLFTNATFPLDFCSDVIQGDHVVVNLSAVDRQQYRKLHGKDLFARVVKNIKRLVSLRDAGKKGFCIEIVYIVNTVNIRQKQKMQKLASQLGVNSVYFKRMDVHDHSRGIALPDTPQAGLKSEGKRTPPACLNGWFYVIVNSEGFISICCLIHRMPLGVFDKVTLKKLWSSKRMMDIRLLGKYGHVQKMYKACQACPFYDENIQRSQDAARERIRR
ncbi:MAG: radical SAM protein [Candidatus Omnitrophica bacterium]|nr:radical SAM protein [Candidatus Omnitrophota bacterium]